MNSSFSEQLKVSPLVWITAAVMLGVLAGSLLGLSTLVWLVLCLAALLGGIAVFLFKRSWRLSIILLPLFLFMGAARYQLSVPVFDQNSISFFNNLDQRVYVTGTLSLIHI